MLPKRESPRHKEAFEYYYRMKKRSLAKVGKKFGVSKVTAENWSRAFHWLDRIAIRDKKVDLKTDEKVSDTIADMNARHVKKWLEVQDVAFASFPLYGFRDAGQAASVAKTAVDGERLARGAPTEHVEHSGDVKVIFEDAVSDGSNSRKRTKNRKGKGDS